MITAALTKISARIVVPDAEAVASALMRLMALGVIVALFVAQDFWLSDRGLILPHPVLPLPGLPLWIEKSVWFLSMGICSVLLVFPQHRRLALLQVAIFVFWVLGDELRWQPFLYMYHFVFLALGLAPKTLSDENLDALRYMTAGIYFWAGFHKINIIFVSAVFPWFVSSWLTNIYVSFLIGAAVPFLEVAIGICLLLPRWRIYGVIVATGMLTVVLLSLMVHGWGMIVWNWNVAIFALAALLFLNNNTSLLSLACVRKKLSAIAILMFWVLPGLGMWGYWGDLPSFKLYCGCTKEIFAEFAPDEDVSFLPPKIKSEIKDRRISATLMTHTYFKVAAVSTLPASDMHKNFLRGLCPHLSKPEDAHVVVLSYPHILSLEPIEKKYPLCAAEGR